MNQATFISSNKGEKILVGAHHFEYRRRKARGSTVYYACREAESMKCKATASTIESDGVIYIKAERGNHTHSSMNHSIYSVIRGFMNEDALARSKFQEIISVS